VFVEEAKRSMESALTSYCQPLSLHSPDLTIFRSAMPASKSTLICNSLTQSLIKVLYAAAEHVKRLTHCMLNV